MHGLRRGPDHGPNPSSRPNSSSHDLALARPSHAVATDGSYIITGGCVDGFQRGLLSARERSARASACPAGRKWRQVGLLFTIERREPLYCRLTTRISAHSTNLAFDRIIHGAAPAAALTTSGALLAQSAWVEVCCIKCCKAESRKEQPPAWRVGDHSAAVTRTVNARPMVTRTHSPTLSHTPARAHHCRMCSEARLWSPACSWTGAPRLHHPRRAQHQVQSTLHDGHW